MKKLQFIIDQLPQLYSRFWLGEVRPPTANTQFEFEWTTGLVKDSKESSWFFNEETRDRKCAFTWMKKQATKPLINMANCWDTLLFARVICEEMDKRHKCRDDEDCHILASCILGSCLCPQGFAGDGELCFDINECPNHSQDYHFHPCQDRGPCRNTWGSYDCSSCDHKLESSHKARPKCQKKSTCDNVSCGLNAECIPFESTFTCRCKEGDSTHGIHCFEEVHTNFSNVIIV